MRRLLFLAFPLLVGCNSAANGTIQIITDDEAGTFTQTPVPTNILVEASNPDGGLPITLATQPYPVSTIDLGNQDQDAVATLGIEATDSNGNELIYGQTVPLQYGALEGETLPVFVQRVGQTARLPNPPSDTRQFPLLSILSDRFLIIAGGTGSTTSQETTWIYDFAQFNLLTPAPTLDYPPASMPIYGTIGFVLDTAGDAEYYDFSGSTTNYTVTSSPPTNSNGYTFASVAGGQVIYDDTDDNGYIFVVGGTRTTGSPTDAVLMISPNDTSNSTYEIGNMQFLQLTTPRLGASAAWVPPYGLVVAGGNTVPTSDAGPPAAGVEAIDAVDGKTLGTALPYAPDESVGSGMAQIDDTHVLMVGGILPSGADAGVRLITLGCVMGCVPTYWPPPNGALPEAITNAYAFDVTNTETAIVVGSEPSTSKNAGLTHLFTLTSAGATEVPLKVPHTNASATLSPVGSILIYGGASGGQIESFTPAPPQ